jgi:hypothetical protein
MLNDLFCYAVETIKSYNLTRLFLFRTTNSSHFTFLNAIVSLSAAIYTHIFTVIYAYPHRNLHKALRRNLLKRLDRKGTEVHVENLEWKMEERMELNVQDMK